MEPLEQILILDFGSQYSQLIARRIRESGVYSVIVPHGISPEEVEELSPKGIILSGGPASVCDAGSPRCDFSILTGDVPLLGICYGMQLMGALLGGKVERGQNGNTGGPSSFWRRKVPCLRVSMAARLSG
jgi:GMP synthase (glutamine-hydrolysing)